MKSKSSMQTNNFKLRSVIPEKMGLLRIEGKQMMRDIITGYIIHNLTGTSSSSYGKVKTRYQPICVILQINGKEQSFNFDFLIILEKYIAMEKQNIDRNGNIEPLILDILDFVDQLEDKSLNTSLQMETPFTAETVLKILVSKHFRDRQRDIMQGQYEEIRKKIYTKYKKVSFIELGANGVSKKQCDLFIDKSTPEENSQRVSRSTITALQKEEYSKKHFPVPTKSKLKELVCSYNVFDHPQKVENLKRQKLIAEYCQNEAQFIEVKQGTKKSYPYQTNSNLPADTAKLLQDWINQISLSQQLFRNKYGHKKDNKSAKKQNSSSSSSDEQSTADLP